MKAVDKVQKAANTLTAAQDQLAIFLFLLTSDLATLPEFTNIASLILTKARKQLEGSFKLVAAVVAERERKS